MSAVLKLDPVEAPYNPSFFEESYSKIIQELDTTDRKAEKEKKGLIKSFFANLLPAQKNKLNETFFLKLKESNCLGYVPMEERSQAFFLAAGSLCASVETSSLLRNLHKAPQFPEDLHERQQFLAALIDKAAVNIIDLPQQLRSRALWLKAVERCPSVLGMRPPGIPVDEDVLIAAVQNEGINLLLLRKEDKTKAVCKAAIKNNPDARRYTPKELIFWIDFEIQLEQFFWFIVETIKQIGSRVLGNLSQLFTNVF